MATLLVSSIVAVSVFSGVISLVVILAIVNYCYRQQGTQGKHGEKGRHIVTVNREPQLRPNLVRYSVDHGHIGIIPWQAGTRYPQVQQQRKPVKQYAAPPPKLQVSPSPGTRRIYASYTHRPVRRVVPIGGSRIAFSPFQVGGNNTLPHVRLGEYRPKVIDDFITPQNIREHEQPNIVKTNVSSNASYDAVPIHHLYEKFASRNGVHWRKKRYEEKTSFINFGEEDGHVSGPTIYNYEKHEERPDGAVVIVDYLDIDDNEEKNISVTEKRGPLSTSTPRYVHREGSNVEKHSDSDSGVNVNSEKHISKNTNVIQINNGKVKVNSEKPVSQNVRMIKINDNRVQVDHQKVNIAKISL